MIKPILTEKGLSEAKKGRFSFYVDPKLGKFQIKSLISQMFVVHVTGVKTANLKKVTKKDYKGKIRTVKARKKATVTLKEKETIDLFDTKK
ncbi:MAG: 50S ribosomal protein L23 [Candidatus Woesebacteria bacterium GW2011_GWA1_39_21]|uniref:50S ribosomal protein L23 n=1 Tax=Candidatus Woesebacteria bacterium GW2011_GWA1_39_21 TaxID=1618550 RepID=A0A0G0N5T5_9BACT|nr:MAG: 50S ribosomal protein L23 [Candidatus Woesebacteria bacterium GW2011_GWA1_39_21]